MKSKVRRKLLKIDGEPVEVMVRLNPRARRLIVKVDSATGEVSVIAPSRRALDSAFDFARKEKAWIANQLAFVPRPVPLAPGGRVLYRGVEYPIRCADGISAADRRRPVWIDREGECPVVRVNGRAEHATRRLTDWLKREARTRLDERTGEFAARIGARPKRITVRDTTSRWGSCSSAKALSFSWRLILAPPHVLDYVVAHEVAHLKELNHGPRFWRLVALLIGDVDRPQTWLHEKGGLLHRYAPRKRA